MDAHDALAAGPVALIVDPALSRTNRDSDQHTAGLTFFRGSPTNPRTAPNARSAYFDLDSVYGDGPAGSPLLYDAVDRAKFRLESSGRFEDLPRDNSGTAIIADPRNDENLIIAGLQIAFLRFHNNAVDLVRRDHPTWTADDIFAAARQLTRWHHQWVILHEVLPLFVGASMVDDVMIQGPRFYVPADGKASIAVDFQIVYRFGQQHGALVLSRELHR
jgi:Animal haem peroxidase